ALPRMVRIHPELSTEDVLALQRVAVAAREVAASVDDARHGLDPEDSVAPGLVSGQRRGWTVDVDAVVSCANGNVALEERAGDGRFDEYAVDICVHDE